MRVSTREPGSGTQTHDGDHLKCFCKDSAAVCIGRSMSVVCEAQQKFGQFFEPMSTIGTSDEYCTSTPSKTGLQSVPRDALNSFISMTALILVSKSASLMEELFFFTLTMAGS